jgi:hypothetical protein
LAGDVAENSNKTQLIVDLLRQTTSLQIVRDFLKLKSLNYSAGSWDDLLNKRIFPAIENNQLTNEELITLLQSVEECGHQHVFLYVCPKNVAIGLMDRGRIASILKNMELEDLLSSPRVLEQPPEAQIVDLRWETAAVDLNLTIKEVELRKFQTFLGTEQHGNQIHKIYGIQEQRAVNVAKLHRDGLLEIRIASLANSTKYEADLRRFLFAINSIILTKNFTELSLSIAKDRFWAERASLGHLIRYSDSTIRDEAGNILRAATGSDESDLSSNVAVGQSLDYLLKEDKNSYCSGANLWFKKTNGLSVDSHVLLTGEPNEFALPANSSEQDYKYVLSQLRSFNQRVS